MKELRQMINSAISLSERGDYASVVQRLTPVYSDCPDDEVLVLLAEALAECGKTALAIELLVKRAQNSDAAPDVLFLLGDEYFAADQHQDALKCYQRLYDDSDFGAEAWVRSGLVRLADGELTQAKSAFLMALERDPQSVSALNSLGDLCLEDDNTVDAKQWFLQALAVDGEDPETCSNLAEVYYTEGDLETAITYANRAISYDEQYACAWLTRGYIALDCDDEDQARRCFNQFIKLEQGAGSQDIIIEVKAVLAALKD